ncbi:methyltransferase domain-containing protein [Nocardia brasiliensis]|uniref:Methyltransferase domain-containing protein n=1 Tax=Nocardia brasiliensis TaxID=37326 RepID=A0A6G9Y0U6_NOCBR|nr:class I SAM-dependent methyltransferase [Nocardia brasiliensis]QIS06829.1 methyltransferase domain-containing protein [Nocardia brasiliensis]
MDATEWDERYAQSELVWGAPPNSTVVEHVFGLERRTPLAPDRTGQVPELPRALDLACGEGRNALWLATHGWQVYAVDYSQVGVDKGRTIATRLSRSVRSRITWECADVTELETEGPFELVLMVFLHLPAEQRRTVLRHAAELLAPEGTLLVLGHDTTNLTDGYGGPKDPSVLFTPDDVVADLAPAIAAHRVRIRLAERVARPTEGRDAIDALVIATRPAAPELEAAE